MIYGIGTDIIEVDRIRRKMERNPELKKMLFTEAEIAYCENIERVGSESFAARFAAKEAFLKAAGTGWSKEFSNWKDIEITNDQAGKPEIKLHSQALEQAEKHMWSKIHVSLSHLRDLAVAFVIIEK